MRIASRLDGVGSAALARGALVRGRRSGWVELIRRVIRRRFTGCVRIRCVERRWRQRGHRPQRTVLAAPSTRTGRTKASRSTRAGPPLSSARTARRRATRRPGKPTAPSGVAGRWLRASVPAGAELPKGDPPMPRRHVGRRPGRRPSRRDGQHQVHESRVWGLHHIEGLGVGRSELPVMVSSPR